MNLLQGSEMEEDSRLLFEAALAGNVSALHQLIHDNPLILPHSALISPRENPLHIATKAGHLDFAQEMLRLRPESVEEVDRYGFRPLDIASALGHTEIVKMIMMMRNGNEICGMKGRDGRTAIHYAALNGKVEVIDELLSSWRDCILDVTSLGETALHLSLKFYKFEAFRTLIKWLEILGLEELVNSSDEDGNTVLHLAVSMKRHEFVQLLLRNSTSIACKLELNAKNLKGLTAMDIMDILVLENPSDAHLQKILQRAGTIRAGLDANSASSTPFASQLQHDAVLNITNSQEPPLMESEKKDWIKHFRFQQERDSPSDTRNVLLVVAALIATVTFQAGVSPPGHYRREENPMDSAEKCNATGKAFSPSPSPYERHSPAITVGLGALLGNLGTQFAASEFFLLGNSLGLAASLCVIIYLTDGFPFQRELHISIYSMLFAYGWKAIGDGETGIELVMQVRGANGRLIQQGTSELYRKVLQEQHMHDQKGESKMNVLYWRLCKCTI
ncbi:hypothetical protein FNV43_RR10780 [Rhamnella rubrinervis]|uniref:PGG domain-containing protein n=1 Tax=Rhamnella rubrinervis TaxID=2594499 RepID=A0A8K0H4V5_9ROSA|nr:hypothetical protein FNV43_RR10780 [Rhamnella rubrinervis]